MSKASRYIEGLARDEDLPPLAFEVDDDGVTQGIAYVDSDAELYIYNAVALTTPQALAFGRWILATFGEEKHA